MQSFEKVQVQVLYQWVLKHFMRCFEPRFQQTCIKTQACPWECHSYGNPMGNVFGMGWGSTHFYFPWDSETEWECQNVTELSYFDYTSEF